MKTKQLETFTFTYQLGWEQGTRQETFIWRYTYRQAYAKAWLVLNNRYNDEVLWMEC